ncbi:MAG: EF-P lysine aminoacylase EpmA [Desulfobulbaceae bacterium]|nr:EF-P lysine aminoacylase EpmA [Desulfobulbaceae bacterium]
MSASRLQERSRLLQAVRSFFFSQGYIEVDTPIRLPIPLPEAHIKPFFSEGWFLHSSPEQCMKRLLARGCTQLFQICHCFRKEEVGRYHQTEFTMLEWYCAGWSYRELMEECEEFLRQLVRAVPGLPGIKDAHSLQWQGRTIPLAPPWQRITVAEAFHAYADMTVAQALATDMFDEVLVTRIEPHLGWDTPVFLYDYPVELGSLARRKQGNDSVAERFELYIGGIEIANGFSELIDPEEQRRRFAAEMNKAQELGNPYPELPEKFLADLANIGDTAGIALGLDRLFMFLLGCASVAEAMSMIFEEL